MNSARIPYLSRVLTGLSTFALAIIMTPLVGGTAHAANGITINYAIGTIYSAGVNVTYTCDPGSGITNLSATVIASPSVGAGGAVPICDGAGHTTTISATCVVPSGCFHFTPGRYVQVNASLGSAAGDSKVLPLQPR